MATSAGVGPARKGSLTGDDNEHVTGNIGVNKWISHEVDKDCTGALLSDNSQCGESYVNRVHT